MITVRTATKEEMVSAAADVLNATSDYPHVVSVDGEVVAYVGVNSVSCLRTQGWPWVRFVSKKKLSDREIIRLSRVALKYWAGKYDQLLACQEEGVNEKWFKVLGFRLDTQANPVYVNGKKWVTYRYDHDNLGRPYAERS